MVISLKGNASQESRLLISNKGKYCQSCASGGSAFPYRWEHSYRHLSPIFSALQRHYCRVDLNWLEWSAAGGGVKCRLEFAIYEHGHTPLFLSSSVYIAAFPCTLPLLFAQVINQVSRLLTSKFLVQKRRFVWQQILFLHHVRHCFAESVVE